MSLFRRYKRWNPVHPTYGAFWGVGVGVGCGVGWGPGFGPESVGFVGSGCGVGINMGVTLVGIGIGLPASGLTCVPCNGQQSLSLFSSRLMLSIPSYIYQLPPVATQFVFLVLNIMCFLYGSAG